jgi:hypothetical protein
VALVRTSYGFKLKGYSPRLLDKVRQKYVSINDLVVHSADLPLYRDNSPKLRLQYISAQKTVMEKRREYLLQNRPFSEMERCETIDAYIETLSFVNKDMEICRFTELQKRDMGVIFQLVSISMLEKLKCAFV